MPCWHLFQREGRQRIRGNEVDDEHVQFEDPFDKGVVCRSCYQHSDSQEAEDTEKHLMHGEELISEVRGTCKRSPSKGSSSHSHIGLRTKRFMEHLELSTCGMKHREIHESIMSHIDRKTNLFGSWLKAMESSGQLRREPQASTPLKFMGLPMPRVSAVMSVLLAPVMVCWNASICCRARTARFASCCSCSWPIIVCKASIEIHHNEHTTQATDRHGLRDHANAPVQMFGPLSQGARREVHTHTSISLFRQESLINNTKEKKCGVTVWPSWVPFRMPTHTASRKQLTQYVATKTQRGTPNSISNGKQKNSKKTMRASFGDVRLPERPLAFNKISNIFESLLVPSLAGAQFQVLLQVLDKEVDDDSGSKILWEGFSCQYLVLLTTLQHAGSYSPRPVASWLPEC